MRFFPSRRGISHAAVDFLSGRGHFACGGGFPFLGEHFACGCGFPFQEGAFRMRLWISFPGGTFRMRLWIPLPGGAFRMRLWISFPGGAFRMRQVRGGEAFIVAKAIVPSSRSSPPGHAAVLRCGMCYFSDGAMDSTMLDIVGCADISN